MEINGLVKVDSNELHTDAKRGTRGVGFLTKKNLVETFEIGIPSKSTEGILRIYMKNRLSNFKINLCVCCIPLDNSTRQGEKEYS